MNEPPPRASECGRAFPRASTTSSRKRSRRPRTTATRAAASSRRRARPRCAASCRAAGLRAAGSLLGALAAAVPRPRPSWSASSATTTAGTAPAPRLAIAPKTMGLIDARSHKVVGRDPVREPAVGRGVRRAPGVGAARRRAPRRPRRPRVAQGALVDARLPFSPGAIATGGGAAWVTEDDGPGLVRLDGTSGRIVERRSRSRSGAIAMRARRASPTGPARSGSRAGRRRCASTPRTAGSLQPHPDPAGGDRSSSPRARSGSRAPRTGGS